MVKQQPLLQSNIGRLTTCVRWVVEYVLGIMSKRYKIMTKIPWGFAQYSGVAIQTIAATHNHFNIGIIQPSISRRYRLGLMKLSIINWSDAHPVPKEEFDDIIKFCKEGYNTTSKFVEWTDGFDITQYWPSELIQLFDYSWSELYVKGGGSGNVSKCKNSLYSSKNIIKIYVGTDEFIGYIFVSKIRMRMKIYYADQESKLWGKTSNVLIKLVSDEVALKNDDSIGFYYSPSLRYLAARCSNIYGRRTINWCSHMCTGKNKYIFI